MLTKKQRNKKNNDYQKTHKAKQAAIGCYPVTLYVTKERARQFSDIAVNDRARIMRGLRFDEYQDKSNVSL